MRRKTAGTAKRKTRRPVTVICRCEEVTEQQVRDAIRAGHRTLEQVKRVLRTGMGHCQGRGCLRIIARIIQEETGHPASEQKLPVPRPPLKPLPLGLLGGRRGGPSRGRRPAARRGSAGKRPGRR